MVKHNNRTDYIICGLLAVATLAVYLQVYGFGFVMIDDAFYVSKNFHVTRGLTLDSFVWAFKTTTESNWHPLTWLSLMADAQIGGSNPSVYHLTNVGLHIVNTLLLFVFFRLATGFRWRAAAVAALFALHPLHVESVAWITERKDVLSTFFWLLTMLAYLKYAARRGICRYLLVVVLFALGLMAKPMLVTLPLVLLLMDIWPLGRVKLGNQGWLRDFWPLVLEKTPLFVMVAISCAITLVVQMQARSVADICDVSVGIRVANALFSYVGYIGKMLWPLNLMALYAHPENTLPVWQVIGAGLLLAAMTFGAFACAAKRPYVTVGWLWYIVTLIPVIGLVQVGQQAMADRYTYVPLIGLFVIFAWGLPDILCGIDGTSIIRCRLLVLSACLLLVGLAVRTYVQVGYWRDSLSLAEHAVDVSGNSYTSHYMLASAYSKIGRRSDAISEYRKSLAISPDNGHVRFGLATVLSEDGRFQDSATEFKRVLKILPLNARVHNEAGTLLFKMKHYDRAIKHYRYALELGQQDPVIYLKMAHIYVQNRDFVNAKKCLIQALRLDPNNAIAASNLAWVQAQPADSTMPIEPNNHK